MVEIDPSRARWLSHPLDRATPAYGGGAGLETEPLTSIAVGDTANTLRFSMPNHLGTHVDMPCHFFEDADDLLARRPPEWIFTRPLLVDVAVDNGGLVTPSALPQDIPPATDMLLIRTGHEQKRGTDAYWREGPGLSAELARWLRTDHRSVRAVGMDLISVTTRLQRQAGREAHRAFLDPAPPGSPLLLIEDMKLSNAPEELRAVVVAPLLIRRADGAPATVVAL